MIGVSTVEQVRPIEQRSNHEGRVGVLASVIRYLAPEPTSRRRWRASPLRFLGFASLFLGARGQLFPAQLELSKLSGTNGFILNGERSGTWSGFSVSNAGDVNADGISDLLVGAPLWGPQNSSGKTYLIFGRQDLGAGGTLELSSLKGISGFVLVGEVGDGSSYSVSGAGDLNADGISDLIIGAPDATPAPGREGAGRTYVVFGKSGLGAGGSLPLSTLNGNNGFVINGEKSDDGSGYSVSMAGDVNGDGIADLLIGATGADPTTRRKRAGRTYVVFGSSNLGASGTLELSSLSGSNGFFINGDAADDRSGTVVSNAGDVNADGIADFLIATDLASPDASRKGAGKTYVVFGKSGLRSSSRLELSLLDGADGFVLYGEKKEDYSGDSVAYCGDINADGVSDLIIGASQASPTANRQYAGKTYVVFGKSSLGRGGVLELSSIDGTNGFVLYGDKAGDFSGTSVSGAGDVDADGIADFLIGAFSADPAQGREGAGRIYIVFGRSGPVLGGVFELVSLDGANGFVLNGEKAGDNSGDSRPSAGDFNGDGISDLIVGTPFADPPGRASAGKAYVLFGRKPMLPSTATLSTAVQPLPTTSSSVAGSVKAISDPRATQSSARPTIYTSSSSSGLDPAILIGIAGAVCALGSSVAAAVLAVKYGRKGDAADERQGHGYANLQPISLEHYVGDAALQKFNRGAEEYLEGREESVPKY